MHTLAHNLRLYQFQKVPEPKTLYLEEEKQEEEEMEYVYGFDPLSINAIHSSGTTIEFRNTNIQKINHMNSQKKSSIQMVDRIHCRLFACLITAIAVKHGKITNYKLLLRTGEWRL